MDPIIKKIPIESLVGASQETKLEAMRMVDEEHARLTTGPLSLARIAAVGIKADIARSKTLENQLFLDKEVND